MRLTAVQRIALLKIRVAMRFRFDGSQPPKPAPAEALEEQRAVLTPSVRFRTWKGLEQRGLIVRRAGGWALTAAGLEALK